MPLKILQIYIFTARIRRMGEGSFQFVCQFTPRRGGVPNPALDRGGVPIQPWMGQGCPSLRSRGSQSQVWGGVPNPALDRGGPGLRSGEGTPSQVQGEGGTHSTPPSKGKKF